MLMSLKAQAPLVCRELRNPHKLARFYQIPFKDVDEFRCHFAFSQVNRYIEGVGDTGHATNDRWSR